MIIKRNNKSIELSESTLEIIIEYFDGYGMVITDSDLIKKRIKQLSKYKTSTCSGKESFMLNKVNRKITQKVNKIDDNISEVVIEDKENI